MNTLASIWGAKVPRDLDNYKILRAGLTAREQGCAYWSETELKHELEAGIRSCIARGSDSLAVPVPSDYVATEAFGRIMNRLRAEGFTVDVAVNSEGVQTSLLLVSPEPGAE